MLFIEPEFQGLLAVIVERQEVKIIACSAVQNPAAVIYRSVDQPICRPAILCLDVQSKPADFQVRIVAKHHTLRRSCCRRSRRQGILLRWLPRKLSGAFDRWRLTRYYTALP